MDGSELLSITDCSFEIRSVPKNVSLDSFRLLISSVAKEVLAAAYSAVRQWTAAQPPEDLYVLPEPSAVRVIWAKDGTPPASARIDMTASGNLLRAALRPLGEAAAEEARTGAPSGGVDWDPATTVLVKAVLGLLRRIAGKQPLSEFVVSRISGFMIDLKGFKLTHTLEKPLPTQSVSNPPSSITGGPHCIHTSNCTSYSNSIRSTPGRRQLYPQGKRRSFKAKVSTLLENQLSYNTGNETLRSTLESDQRYRITRVLSAFPSGNASAETMGVPSPAVLPSNAALRLQPSFARRSIEMEDAFLANPLPIDLAMCPQGPEGKSAGAAPMDVVPVADQEEGGTVLNGRASERLQEAVLASTATGKRALESEVYLSIPNDGTREYLHPVESVVKTSRLRLDTLVGEPPAALGTDSSPLLSPSVKEMVLPARLRAGEFTHSAEGQPGQQVLGVSRPLPRDDGKVWTHVALDGNVCR